jgi:hypothetical protein
MVQQEGKLVHSEVVILVDVQLQEDSQHEFLRVVFFQMNILAEEVVELFEGNGLVRVRVCDQGVIIDGCVLVGIIYVGFVGVGQ